MLVRSRKMDKNQRGGKPVIFQLLSFSRVNSRHRDNLDCFQFAEFFAVTLGNSAICSNENLGIIGKSKPLGRFFVTSTSNYLIETNDFLRLIFLGSL